MSHQTKMLLNLSWPALVVTGASMLLAVVATMLGSLPAALGGQALWPGLGDAIALGGLVLSLGVYGVQLHRYARWTQGEGDCCYVCSSLLGRERDGRFGPYRKCLGCGRNHAFGRI